MVQANIYGDLPKICASAHIHESAVVIGNVVIGENVFVGPCAVVRADEENSSIVIGDNSNIQDGVIIHCLENSSAVIGKSCSLAHGSIVHGPATLADNCFVGFNSVVFGSQLQEGVVVKHSCVLENVLIPKEKLIKSASFISSENDTLALTDVDDELRKFADGVVGANRIILEGIKDRKKRGCCEL